ncbi:hypothetical protein [Chryseobacterium sp.]|uniref:hypothetical protein n=1 Tax=Chryseobacterium sp. TaxID=1871047 RepID=UPI00321992FE
MVKPSVDYSKVHLQERIPLTNEEINNLASQKRDFFKDVPGILLAVILIISTLIIFFLRKELGHLKFYYYILGIVFLIIFYYSCYWAIGLVYKNSVKNWTRDIENGKNKLTTVILHRHKTEDDEYIFTFAGRDKREKIRLAIEKDNYSRYKSGDKVIVVYLKYSKTVLSIYSDNDSV